VDAVVLTTGGYGADPDGFLRQYTPDYELLPTTNGPWATGDGIHLGVEIGAKLRNMDKVQVHPTGFLDRNNRRASSVILAPEALRGSGAILVHPASGKRFVDELSTRDVVTRAIFVVTEGMTTPFVYLVMNDEACIKFQNATLGFYRAKGLLKYYPGGAEEFSKSEQGYPPAANLKQTFQEYSKGADRGRDSTGKTTFPVLFSHTEPLHVAAITPAVHYTMGGLDVSPATTAVIHNGSTDPSTIAGLFAAGEVTGVTHGKNRLAGNSLLECVVFGRIAGNEAANFAMTGAAH